MPQNNKQTDVIDLQNFINGDKIEQYNEEIAKLNEKEREKNEELIKQKKRKLPVSLPIQTDPPQGVDFGIQIKDGEEMIPFVDYRPQSADLKRRKMINLTENSNCNEKVESEIKIPLKKSNSITNVIDYYNEKDEFFKRKSRDYKTEKEKSIFNLRDEKELQ